MKLKKSLLILSMVVLCISCSKGKEYTSYDHYQTLDFSSYGYGINIFKEPFTEDVIYTVKEGDKIKVTEFRVYKNKECYIKVKLPSEGIGYISFGKNNVYKNGNGIEEFNCIEKIEVNSKQIWVLNFNETLGVYSDYLYSLPDIESERVYELTDFDKSNYAKTVAITNDFEWIKFNISDKSGWVPKECVYRDRGGPAYWTPANSIKYELIDKYQPGEL